MTIDLSVEVSGVTFRNPIIPGAAETVMDERDVAKCIKQGIGGIVTKSIGPVPVYRARPYWYNFRVFGRGLGSNWTTMGGPHPLTFEQAAEKVVPKMARLCRDEGIPLIVNMMGGTDLEQWVTGAKLFEQAGANMLELIFSGLAGMHALDTKKVSRKILGADLASTIEVISSVKKAVKIPVCAKVSFGWHPFRSPEEVKAWVEAGADCITGSLAETGLGGMLIDVEEEVPFGALGRRGYIMGRSSLPIHLYSHVQMRKALDVPIIATGGVYQGIDAVMYLLIGCPVVQVGSAVFQHGYSIFGEIIKGIEEWMARKGYSSINDFLGKAYELAAQPFSPDLIHMEQFVFPEEKSSPVIPEVDMDKCTLCKMCEDFCLWEVLTVDKGRGVVNIDHENKCWGCGNCVGWCPANAIKLIDKDTKEVVWDNRGLARPYRPENWKRQSA